MSAEDQLAEQYRRQQEIYDRDYKPFIEQLEKEADSRDFVNDATATAGNLGAVTAEQVNRAQSRTMGGRSAAQLADSERRIDSSTTAAGSSMINMARANQRTRNEGILNSITGISNAMASGATADLGQIAAQQQQRQQEYEKQKQGLLGNVLGVVGGIAGSVIMPGPVGASIGAGIGSSIGGLF